jgi:RimJ/RimL family protein N-acetyltransferase
MKTHWDRPSRTLTLENDAVVLTPVGPDSNFQALFEAACPQNNEDTDLFAYHVNTPRMETFEIYRGYLQDKLRQPHEVVYQIFSRRLGAVVGCASLMNLRPDHGVVEVGSIWYSHRAQRTEINTNAMYLLFCHVFDDLGYRRLEWKCNSRNEASMRAAVRLGFEWEGVFRQHFVSRGENRDTVWYSIIDLEWPAKKRALHQLTLPRNLP